MSLIWATRELRALNADRRMGLVSVEEADGRMREYLAAISAILSFDIHRKLRFAEGVGASLGPVFEIVSAHCIFLWGLQAEINKGKTSAQLTGYFLRWLPWLALLCTEFMGLGSITYLLTHWIGWAILVIAGGLSYAAGRVAKAILEHANKPFPDPALWLNIVATALKQGVGVNRCIEELRRVTGARLVFVEREVASALERGGSLVTHLEHAALEQRESVREQKLLSVERLPFQLLLPMGLFLLPQFLLLLVAPMILAALPAHLIL